MRWKWGLLLFCVSPLLWAGVQLENVRIWAAPDSTRVVFDISAPVKYKSDLLSDPYRLVLDIDNTRITARHLTQPGSQDKYLQRLRGARRNGHDLRLVLDLKKYSRTRVFQLAPNEKYGNRLVVDIYNTEAEEKARDAAIESEAMSRNMRDVIIAVDAGHGGEDPGATGPDGTHEKTVTLKLAKVLAAMIDKQRGMHAVLTRTGDYFMSLRARIVKARRYKADMFISIHADAFKDPSVHGASVYVLSSAGSSSEHAKWLAERENAADLIGGVKLDNKDNVLASVLLDLSQTASLEASIDVAGQILKRLKRVGTLHKSDVESAGFAVLKSPDIPSVLVETAYITNPKDERSLCSPRHRHQVARALLQAIEGYFNRHAPPGSLLAMHKHIIVRGDTLSTIAQHYRVSLKRLRAVNGIKGDLVQTGEVLRIPTSGTDG